MLAGNGSWSELQSRVCSMPIPWGARGKARLLEKNGKGGKSEEGRRAKRKREDDCHKPGGERGQKSRVE